MVSLVDAVRFGIADFKLDLYASYSCVLVVHVPSISMLDAVVFKENVVTMVFIMDYAERYHRYNHLASSVYFTNFACKEVNEALVLGVSYC